MAAYVAALRKEVLEQWRSYRALVVGVVLLAFGLLSPLAAKYTPEIIRLLPNGDQLAGLIPAPTALDAVAQYLKNMSQFTVILGMLLAMGLVVTERERGTAALLLSKPLPRWAFLAAKFTALALSFALALALAGVGAWYYTWLLFGPLDAGAWLGLNALLWVFTLVYVAVALLCSVLARTQAAAAGLAFGALLVLGVLGAIPQIGQYLPGQLVNWASALYAGGEAAWPALGISLALIMAALGVAWWRFERQEL
jgi:ABC-2 type transport system permease protein